MHTAIYRCCMRQVYISGCIAMPGDPRIQGTVLPHKWMTVRRHALVNAEVYFHKRFPRHVCRVSFVIAIVPWSHSHRCVNMCCIQIRYHGTHKSALYTHYTHVYAFVSTEITPKL